MSLELGNQKCSKEEFLLLQKPHLHFFQNVNKGCNQTAMRVIAALTCMTSPKNCSTSGDDGQYADRVVKGSVKGGAKGTRVLLHIRGNAIYDKLLKIRTCS